VAARLLPGGGDEDERLVAAVRAGDDEAFERIVRRHEKARLTSKVIRLRCPAGYVAEAPVPPAEKDYVPEIRGERIENSDDYGRATYVDWRIFYGAKRFKPRELVRDIGLVCRKRPPG
jgi:hypothetical protein